MREVTARAGPRGYVGALDFHTGMTLREWRAFSFWVQYMSEDGANDRKRSAVVLCPAATSSYDELVFGTERTKMIMKPEKKRTYERLWRTFVYVEWPSGTRPDATFPSICACFQHFPLIKGRNEF